VFGQVASLPLTMGETEAKETLKEAIAEYINVRVVYAHKVIAETANTKVSHGLQLQPLNPNCNGLAQIARLGPTLWANPVQCSFYGQSLLQL
jgi:hypothetical protein